MGVVIQAVAVVEQYRDSIDVDLATGVVTFKDASLIEHLPSGVTKEDVADIARASARFRQQLEHAQLMMLAKKQHLH